jgi:hypothetical protein
MKRMRTGCEESAAHTWGLVATARWRAPEVRSAPTAPVAEQATTRLRTHELDWEARNPDVLLKIAI